MPNLNFAEAFSTNEEENTNIYGQPGQFTNQSGSRREPAFATNSQRRDKRLQTSYERALLLFTERPKRNTAVCYVGEQVQKCQVFA